MNAYGMCMLHMAFHTKYSRDVLPEAFEHELYAYLGGLLQELGCHPIKIGGYDDHIHAAFDLGRELSISEAVGKLKANASRWLKRHAGYPAFTGRQRGYGYFSVGPSQRPVLERYVARRRIHHRKQTSREEVQMFLDRYGVTNEEAYLPEEKQR